MIKTKLQFLTTRDIPAIEADTIGDPFGELAEGVTDRWS